MYVFLYTYLRVSVPIMNRRKIVWFVCNTACQRPKYKKKNYWDQV